MIWFNTVLKIHYLLKNDSKLWTLEIIEQRKIQLLVSFI